MSLKFRRGNTNQFFLNNDPANNRKRFADAEPVFDSEAGILYVGRGDGIDPVVVGSSSGVDALAQKFTFSDTSAGDDVFTGMDDDAKTLLVSANNTAALNGIFLTEGDDYSIESEGATLRFINGLVINESDDVLHVVSRPVTAVNDTVKASTGGDFNGDVSVQGNFSADAYTGNVSIHFYQTTAGQTVIDNTTARIAAGTLDVPATDALVYDMSQPEKVDINVGGIPMAPYVDWLPSANTITFKQALLADDTIYIRVWA